MEVACCKCGKLFDVGDTLVDNEKFICEPCFMAHALAALIPNTRTVKK